ncbi:right-handed parallel beta-helix repeat-containing protein [Bacteroides xylanisolvens]|uniref:right-handed parallel beta-helix repeat-containing protein n=1 Tax=Bacteroides xylanisolvens TaxID=371601 RepID=UPI00189AA91F|nr:right-handed parallel beta-helix repeat-containing protein [Bacteroides xylanisolvens]
MKNVLVKTAFIFLSISLCSCSYSKDPSDLLPPYVILEIPNTPEQPDDAGPQPGNGTDYYVSSTLGNDNNAGTVEKPFQSIAKAAEVAKPGDKVNIMNGTYTTKSSPVLNLKSQHSGTEGNYITYRAHNGHKPVIYASGEVWNAVQINASYIIIDGLEFKGDNDNLTYEAAKKAYDDAKAGTASPQGKFNTNALTIGGSKKESQLPHHVTVRNCVVHDFPGSGLNAIQADYIRLENNVVYNTSWYTMYATSGMSILCPYNSDGNEGYKIIIRNNTCYNNKTTVPWINTENLSDGNGIIIDINNKPYDGGVIETNEAYRARTLVQNNVCYNNGGSGIHAFEANHVDIVNNTAYKNARVMTTYGNIYAAYAEDVYILNNIIHAGGGVCTTNNRNQNVIYDYNIYFDGTVAAPGRYDKTADPKFKKASVDPAEANFKVEDNSPAIDSGVKAKSPAKDKEGIARPKGAGIDRGAYEIK